jgi:hypothetical protein
MVEMMISLGIFFKWAVMALIWQLVAVVEFIFHLKPKSQCLEHNVFDYCIKEDLLPIRQNVFCNFQPIKPPKF